MNCHMVNETIKCSAQLLAFLKFDRIFESDLISCNTEMSTLLAEGFFIVLSERMSIQQYDS